MDPGERYVNTYIMHVDRTFPYYRRFGYVVTVDVHVPMACISAEGLVAVRPGFYSRLRVLSGIPHNRLIYYINNICFRS
jgi:hypothetical protein